MPENPKRPAREGSAAGQPEWRDDPGGRAHWFRRSRQRADGKLTGGLIGRASRQKRRRERELWIRRQTTVRPPVSPGAAPAAAPGAPIPAPPAAPGGPGTINWKPLGPEGITHGMGGATNPIVSGRITALAVGPGGQRVYAGSANGGVWFSGDGGDTWKALDEWAESAPQKTGGLEIDALSIGAVAVRFGDAAGSSSDSSSASSQSDTIYVGTGEPNGSLDGYYGVGIKVSTDGGNVFTLEGNSNLAGAEVHQIVIDPVDPSLVFAATTKGIFRRPAGPDFSKWLKVTDPSSADGEVTDLVVAGSGANRVYYAAADGQVFQSTDIVSKSADQVTWKPVGGIAKSGPPWPRKALAAGENDKSVVYCLVADATLYRVDSGTAGSFQSVGGVPATLFSGGQGWYDLVLAADPADANVVYLAGDYVRIAGSFALSLYRGTVSGGPGSYQFTSAPTWVGAGVHPDGHALAFATNANGTHDGSIVWVGCDGGVFRSTSSGAAGTFDAKNKGLAITQFTYISVPSGLPDIPDRTYGGCQDNGTLRYAAAETPPWVESAMGDGGGVAINPRSSSQIIRQYTFASLDITSDDGANWTSDSFPPDTVESSRTAFYTPIKAFDTGSKTLVVFGTNRLWFRGDWTDPWVTLPAGANPYQGGADPAKVHTQDVLEDTDPNTQWQPPWAGPRPVTITAVAIGSPTRIVAATSSGKVWQFDLSGATWSKKQLPQISSPAPATVFVTALAFEDGAKGSLYAALGSDGGEHILYFDGNDGSQWQSANLKSADLDVPSHAVAVHPADANTVFLGTDVGVWKGVKSGASWTWTPFSSGLPESAVSDLAVSPYQTLRAATHGRGVWEIDVSVADLPPSSSSSESSSSTSSSADSSSSSSADSSSSSADSSSSSDSSTSSSADSSSSSSSDSSSSSADSSSSSSDSSSSSADSSSSTADSSSSDSGSSSSSDDSSSSAASGRAAPRAPLASAKGAPTQARTPRRKSK